MNSPKNPPKTALSLSASAFSIFQRDVFIYITLLFTSIFISRILGPSEMGLWSILLLLPSYATALGSSQTDVASVYFIARKELDVSTAASALLTISIFMWLLILMIFLIAQGWLFESPLRHFQDREWLVLVMLVSALLDWLAMNYMHLMLAEEDIRGFNWYAVIRSTLAPLLGVLMLWAIGPEIEYLAWAVVIGTSAALLYGVTRVHRSHTYRFSIDTRAIRTLVSYGAKLYVGSLIGFAGVYLTGGLIAIYLTQDSVAFFQIALTRALLLGKLASTLGDLLYPRIASFKEDVSGAIALFTTAIRVNILITGTAAIAMVAIAGPAIRLLYGDEYEPVTVPFMILTIGVAFDSMTAMTISLFQARGRPVVPTLLATIVIVPQIAALAIFIPRGDVVLAAWISTGAFLLGAVIRVFSVKRSFSIGLGKMLIPRKADFVLIVSSLSRIIQR